MRTVYINGKFAAQPITGVQRVARQLVLSLDALLPLAQGRSHRAGAGEQVWVLLLPPGCSPLPLQHIVQCEVGRPGRSLHLWEQTTLPMAARSGLLVNLAGGAPYGARWQVAMLHDAAVFDHPEAYSRTFVAWYRCLFRRLARTAVQLLTVSEFSRQRLALHLGVAPERLMVMHNGCDHLDSVEPDLSVLDRHGLRGRSFFLAVGSENPTKNLDALVQAHARLWPETGVRLVVAGRRNPRVFSSQAAERTPDGVLRIGAVGDGPLKALYAAATALVFPSVYEGFGLPPLEAMRCGCPVLAARMASLPEVCADAALYFDATNDAALAVAMRTLSMDDALRARLREAGTARARQFPWQQAAHKLLGAIEAVA